MKRKKTTIKTTINNRKFTICKLEKNRVWWYNIYNFKRGGSDEQ